MTSRADVVAATRLVRRALDRERPKAGGDYEMLLARYRTDSGFADTVAAVCEGLSLYPLGVGPAGLVVHGDMDGPFRVTLDNSGLRNARDAEHRHIYALVIAGIAAYGYRDTGALIDTAAPVIRPLDLEKFLARAVDRVAGVRDGHEAADTDDWEVFLGEAGRQWRERPAYHETPQGRPKVGCHRWYTTTVLEWLVDRDMAVRQVVLSDERGMAYQLTDRFRLGIGDLVETEAFATLTAPDNQPLDHDPDRSTSGVDAAGVHGAAGNARRLRSALGSEGETAD